MELVGQLADALDAAHARGLIHRDVKPSNALVAREGPREHVYLSDFGLTKTSGPDPVTASGQVMGTVAYMAPEVIRGEQPARRRTCTRSAASCSNASPVRSRSPGPTRRRSSTATSRLAAARAMPGSCPARWTPCSRARWPRIRPRATSPARRLVAAARAALDPKRSAGGAPPSPSRAAAAPQSPSPSPPPPPRPCRGPTATQASRPFATDAVAVIDPGERSLRAQVALDGPPSAVAAAPGAIWVAGDRDGTVSRIDPETHTVRQTVTSGTARAPSPPTATASGPPTARTAPLADLGRDERSRRHVQRREPDRRLPARRRRLGRRRRRGRVLRFDPDTHRAAPSPSAPDAVGAGVRRGRRLGRRRRRAAARISPATNSVRHTLDVGAGPSALAAGGGALGREPAHRHGVARRSRARSRHGDRRRSARPTSRSRWPSAPAASGWPTAGRRRSRASIPSAPSSPTGSPSAASPARSPSWTAASGWRSPPRGRAIAAARCASPSRGAIDFRTRPGRSTRRPATPRARLLSLTNDGLTAFRRVGGTAGAELVPDLAERSRRRRTAAARTRSPFATASGSRPAQPVRPSDIKRGIERSLNAKQAAFGLLERDQVDRGRRREPDDRDPPQSVPIRTSSTGSRFPSPPRCRPERRRRRRVVAATGPYRIARFEPAACPSRAQPLLPDVVRAREAGRLSGRDRRPAGRHGAQGHRGRPRRSHGCRRS